MKRFVVVVAFAACSVDVSTAPSAITNGSDAPDDVAVVAVIHRSVRCEPETVPLECSGTLVAPRVVVTAAHCLEQGPANALEAYIGASYPDGGTHVPVVLGRAHPLFDPETHANDIAVLVLAADAPAAPAPMRGDALPDLVGSDVRLVGFGITSGTASDVGTRRAGVARVTEIAADELRVAAGPAMSCKGDSGGPVFAPTGPSGGEELVGVTSWGDPACTQFGVAMRVDRYRPFIQSVIDEAAALGQRRAFDPTEDFCATTCATDADCPEETICFADHCAYNGLPAADFGDACTTDAACSCVAMPDGTCRELVPCFSEGDSTCHMTTPPDDSGCGCHTSDRGSALLVAGALALVLRRQGAKKRSNC